MPDRGRTPGRRPHPFRRRGTHRHAWAQRASAGPPRANLHFGGRMIEAVIFDLDGVLIDSEHVWDEVRQQLAEERGGQWSDNASRDMMGMSSPEWSRYMRDAVGLEDEPTEISAEVV